MNKIEAEIRIIKHLMSFVDNMTMIDDDFFEFKELDGQNQIHFTDEEIKIITERANDIYTEFNARIFKLQRKLERLKK